MLGRWRGRGPVTPGWAGTASSSVSACCPRRFIKSERSIILLNFCLSILASNILILVGQSRVLSKAGAGSGVSECAWGDGGKGRERLQVMARLCVCPSVMDVAIHSSCVLGEGVGNCV